MKTQPEAPKCERKEELIEYLYDEMPLQRRALFADHLAACASCSVDLAGLEQVRGDLRAWDVSTVPHMELIIPRSKLDVLKELLSMFPVWSRALMATATAAATILIALGTISLFRQMNAAPNTLANNTSAGPAQPPAPTQPAAQPLMLPADVKALVNAEVAKAVEQALDQERQALRAQMASLDVRNQEQRVQLQAVTRQLRMLSVRHQEMLAAQQPSIRSIFTELEPSSER